VVTLTLDEQDAQVLSEVLANDLSDLRMEISHTDLLAFREGLKRKKESLRRVLAALETATAPSI
jgi:hypothetical protein